MYLRANLATTRYGSRPVSLPSSAAMPEARRSVLESAPVCTPPTGLACCPGPGAARGPGAQRGARGGGEGWWAFSPAGPALGRSAPPCRPYRRFEPHPARCRLTRCIRIRSPGPPTRAPAVRISRSQGPPSIHRRSSLFTELQEKNQALTQAHAQVSEALEQQTATAEILQATAVLRTPEIGSSSVEFGEQHGSVAQRRLMPTCGDVRPRLRRSPGRGPVSPHRLAQFLMSRPAVEFSVQPCGQL